MKHSISVYDIYNILFYIMNFWLLIDCINGFFLANHIGIPLSQIYKIIILGILFIGLAKLKGGISYICIILLYLAVLITHLAINIIKPTIGITLNHIMKFLTTILIYTFIVEYVKVNPYNTYPLIKKILTINTIILVINILLGLLGFGYSAYVEGLGYRGFFYAGNELSGLMTILFPYMLYQTGERYSYKSLKYISSAILFLITAALLGTKTSLLMILLAIIVLPNLSIKLSKLHKLILPLSFVLIIISISIYYLLDYLGLMERWVYFYDKGGIEALLFSGRTDFWAEEKDIILNSGIWQKLLGLGGAQTVEMDPFDSFLNYGYIGVVICYSFYLYLIIKSFLYRKNKIARLVFFINITLISASSIAGHIMFSGMASCFIALINTLIYIPEAIITTRYENKKNSTFLHSQQN